MDLLSVLLFAFAVSLDGFGVGIAYGMRKIKIPFYSLLVISITSAGAISISMLGGHFVAELISVRVAEIIGAGILITIGSWIIFQTLFKGQGRKPQAQEDQELLKIRLKPFGLVIQIIREPASADIDRSGVISGTEAFLLGLALAMDAFGAGFAAAMMGLKLLVTPLFVGLTKFFLVALGDLVGRRYAPNWIVGKAAAIPGWVLVILGVARVLKL